MHFRRRIDKGGECAGEVEIGARTAGTLSRLIQPGRVRGVDDPHNGLLVPGDVPRPVLSHGRATADVPHLQLPVLTLDGARVEANRGLVGHVGIFGRPPARALAYRRLSGTVETKAKHADGLIFDCAKRLMVRRYAVGWNRAALCTPSVGCHHLQQTRYPITRTAA